MRLVVRRVDRDEGVDVVIEDSEIAFIITSAGRRYVHAPWKNMPIEWPERAAFVGLADGRLYRSQERGITPLQDALPPHFVIAHTGLLVNLDRVRFLSRGRPLMLGFALDGSADPKEALWALVARGRTRGLEDRLGWLRRTAPVADRSTGNVDEVDEEWEATVLEVHDGRRRSDDEEGD